MAKEHGLGNALYVSGHDLSGETQTWNLSGTKPMQNATTLRQLAFDRLGLIPDSAFSYETLLDPAVGKSHEYLSTLPTADQLVSLLIRETLGWPVASMFVKQLNYDGTRGNDGALLFKTDSSSSKGTFWDWGVLLTAGIRTDAAATNGAGVDMGANFADFNFGLQAYLQVFNHTGDDVTVKLQQSSDNGVGDAWADVVGGSFGAITAASGRNGYRLTTARNQTIERYLRVVTTGTFAATSFPFMVSAVVNNTNVAV